MTSAEAATDRIEARVYLQGELIIQTDVTEYPVDVLDSWRQGMEDRGCTVTFKRITNPEEGEPIIMEIDLPEDEEARA